MNTAYTIVHLLVVYYVQCGVSYTYVQRNMRAQRASTPAILITK